MVSARSWFRFSALSRRISSASAIGIDTTDAYAWISWACCFVSGAALGVSFAGVDVFIVVSFLVICGVQRVCPWWPALVNGPFGWRGRCRAVGTRAHLS